LTDYRQSKTARLCSQPARSPAHDNIAAIGRREDYEC